MLARFLKDKYHAHYDPAETPEAASGVMASWESHLFPGWIFQQAMSGLLEGKPG